MITPDPTRTTGPMVPGARSPQILLKLGDMYQKQGDYANASKLYDEAVGIFEDADDVNGVVDPLLRLGKLRLRHSKSKEAIAVFSRLLEISTSPSVDKKRIKLNALYGLALAYQLKKNHNTAATFFREVLNVSTDIKDSNGRADALFGLAGLNLVQREYSQAVPLYTEAMQISTDLGHRGGRASALEGLGDAKFDQDKDEEAIKFYSDALQIYTDIRDSRGRARALSSLADVSLKRHRLENALDLYEQVYKIWEQIGDTASNYRRRNLMAYCRRKIMERDTRLARTGPWTLLMDSVV